MIISIKKKKRKSERKRENIIYNDVSCEVGAILWTWNVNTGRSSGTSKYVLGKRFWAFFDLSKQRIQKNKSQAYYLRLIKEQKSQVKTLVFLENHWIHFRRKKRPFYILKYDYVIHLIDFLQCVHLINRAIIGKHYNWLWYNNPNIVEITKVVFVYHSNKKNLKN